MKIPTLRIKRITNLFKRLRDIQLPREPHPYYTPAHDHLGTASHVPPPGGPIYKADAASHVSHIRAGRRSSSGSAFEDRSKYPSGSAARYLPPLSGSLNITDGSSYTTHHLPGRRSSFAFDGRRHSFGPDGIPLDESLPHTNRIGGPGPSIMEGAQHYPVEDNGGHPPFQRPYHILEPRKSILNLGQRISVHLGDHVIFPTGNSDYLILLEESIPNSNPKALGAGEMRIVSSSPNVVLESGRRVVLVLGDAMGEGNEYIARVVNRYAMARHEGQTQNMARHVHVPPSIVGIPDASPIAEEHMPSSGLRGPGDQQGSERLSERNDRSNTYLANALPLRRIDKEKARVMDQDSVIMPSGSALRTSPATSSDIANMSLLNTPDPQQAEHFHELLSQLPSTRITEIIHESPHEAASENPTNIEEGMKPSENEGVPLQRVDKGKARAIEPNVSDIGGSSSGFPVYNGASSTANVAREITPNTLLQRQRLNEILAPSKTDWSPTPSRLSPGFQPHATYHSDPARHHVQDGPVVSNPDNINSSVPPYPPGLPHPTSLVSTQMGATTGRPHGILWSAFTPKTLNETPRQASGIASPPNKTMSNLFSHTMSGPASPTTPASKARKVFEQRSAWRRLNSPYNRARCVETVRATRYPDQSPAGRHTQQWSHPAMQTDRIPFPHNVRVGDNIAGEARPDMRTVQNPLQVQSRNIVPHDDMNLYRHDNAPASTSFEGRIRPVYNYHPVNQQLATQYHSNGQSMVERSRPGPSIISHPQLHAQQSREIRRMPRYQWSQGSSGYIDRPRVFTRQLVSSNDVPYRSPKQLPLQQAGYVPTQREPTFYTSTIPHEPLHFRGPQTTERSAPIHIAEGHRTRSANYETDSDARVRELLNFPAEIPVETDLSTPTPKAQFNPGGARTSYATNDSSMLNAQYQPFQMDHYVQPPGVHSERFHLPHPHIGIPKPATNDTNSSHNFVGAWPRTQLYPSAQVPAWPPQPIVPPARIEDEGPPPPPHGSPLPLPPVSPDFQSQSASSSPDMNSMSNSPVAQSAPRRPAYPLTGSYEALAVQSTIPFPSLSAGRGSAVSDPGQEFVPNVHTVGTSHVAASVTASNHSDVVLTQGNDNEQREGLTASSSTLATSHHRSTDHPVYDSPQSIPDHEAKNLFDEHNVHQVGYAPPEYMESLLS
ncbi:hypothetical protein FB446DRAFT_290773 [Lentinula raphanica]|nr:hypothetical protein FB446DRAFT_290773 [Lentinula raphanica]